MQVKPRHILSLALVLLLGAFVRIHRLSFESPWYDEVITLRHLADPSLRMFLAHVEITNPTITPGYFIFEYYWAHWVDPSAMSLRAVSVVAGVLTLAMLYVLARRFIGHNGAILASALMAVNPLHVYHSQAIRMYAPIVLLGLVSAYTYFRLLHTPRPLWWMFHFAANLALVWIHPLTAPIFVTEGLVLLFFERKRPRLVSAWFGGHAAIAISLLGWIASIDPVAARNQGGSVTVPTIFRSDARGNSIEHVLGQWSGGYRPHMSSVFA